MNILNRVDEIDGVTIFMPRRESSNDADCRYFVSYASFKNGAAGFGNLELVQNVPLEEMAQIRQAAVSIQEKFGFDAVVILSIYPFGESEG